MTSSRDNFLGLPPELSDYGRARVAVLPVPYEATVSYGGGTARAPHAIIHASAQVELYDEELRIEPCDAGIATLAPLAVEGIVPSALTARVAPAVSAILADGKLPMLFGGEHSITPAAIEGVRRHHGDITVVQLDAHADLREEYEGERMSHACAMARVRDVCPVVQVGIRNLSKEEAAWVERDKLPVFFAHEMQDGDRWMDRAIARIGTEKVYVTIDVDVFDSGIMPATGTPEPGGLGWYGVTGFVRRLAKAKHIVGFDLVELSPIAGFHACDFLVAKLAAKCIGYWWKSGR
jgi:agmatinase